MKAILIIDMPKSCEDCELCRDFYLCLRLGEVYESVENGTKDLRCPLKPMPKHYPSTSDPQRIEYLKQLGMTEKEQHYYELGHDDCVEEILGEKE